MKKYKLILGGMALGLLVGLFPGRVKALSPKLDLQARDEGGEVIVSVYLYPHYQPISGVETSLKFDQMKLKFKDFQAGKLLPVVVMEPSGDGQGKIHFALGINPDNQGVRKSGKIAELDFEKLKDGPSRIETEGTIITSLNKDTNAANSEAQVVVGQGEGMGVKPNFWQKIILWLKSLFSK